MNKAFEKILESLEEEARFYNSASDSDQYIREGICISQRIVQEVADEYNGGWIPCSEQLPTTEEYHRGNGRFLVTDGNRTYEAEFDIYESHTFGRSQMASNWFVTDNCVTHWQNEPLPTLYKERD